MRSLSHVFFIAVSCFALIGCLPLALQAQGIPTASRAVAPSAFAGLTGTYTGLNGGRNLGFTAGLDVAIRPFFGLTPSAEVRGTYPLDSGQIAGEESVLAGLRVGKRFNHVRPYADILFGRGALNYQSGGYVVPAQDFKYIRSTTNVVSPGIGVEVDLTERFSLLIDGQLQRWQVPFDPSRSTINSSHVLSTPGTLGVVYRFGWLQHGHAAP